MFCQKCGREMRENDRFCPSCGWNKDGTSVTGTDVRYSSVDQFIVQDIIRKRRRQKGCLFTFLAVVCIIAVAMIIGGSNVAKRINSASNQENSESEKTTDSKTDEIVARGSIGNIGDLFLCINASEKSDEIEYADGWGSYIPEDGGKFAIVNVTITNPTKNAKSIMLSDFELENSDGAKYSAGIVGLADEKYINIDSINPDLNVEGNLAFEIPEDANLSDFKLIYTGFDSLGSSQFEITD